MSVTMADVVIQAAQRLGGTVRVPADRSITVRAALLAAVARGTSHIRGALVADDTVAAFAALERLGVPLRWDTGDLIIEGRGLFGLRPRVDEPLGDGVRGVRLFCGASGTTLRLLAGLLAGQPFASVLDGATQLRRRPMRRVTEPLRALGARLADTAGYPPFLIQAACGDSEPAPLHGGDFSLPVASAQVASALLLAGLYARSPVTVTVPQPVRDHTPRLMAAMGADVSFSACRHALRGLGRGLHPIQIAVPGDFSSAAFFLVAGSLLPGALTLESVGVNPTRTGLLDVLAAMGAPVEVLPSAAAGPEPVATLRPRHCALRALELAAPLTATVIDELPILAVAATQAHGTTTVRDAGELRVKESDRIGSIVRELKKMGAVIEEREDGFVVEGPRPLRGALVDAHEDHRIAMALAVAGLLASGATRIRGAAAVTKTYPAFFEDLARCRRR
jgi:3-phosphoshikimate 1-carboxyvinyltransferase